MRVMDAYATLLTMHNETFNAWTIANRIPCFTAGTFDIIGSSSQLLHTCITIGAHREFMFIYALFEKACIRRERFQEGSYAPLAAP